MMIGKSVHNCTAKSKKGNMFQAGIAVKPLGTDIYHEEGESGIKCYVVR
jgi:hypothetical protein